MANRTCPPPRLPPRLCPTRSRRATQRCTSFPVPVHRRERSRRRPTTDRSKNLSRRHQNPIAVHAHGVARRRRRRREVKSTPRPDHRRPPTTRPARGGAWFAARAGNAAADNSAAANMPNLIQRPRATCLPASRLSHSFAGPDRKSSWEPPDECRWPTQQVDAPTTSKAHHSKGRSFEALDRRMVDHLPAPRVGPNQMIKALGALKQSLQEARRVAPMVS